MNQSKPVPTACDETSQESALEILPEGGNVSSTLISLQNSHLIVNHCSIYSVQCWFLPIYGAFDLHCLFDVFIWSDNFSTSSPFLGNALILNSRTQLEFDMTPALIRISLSTHTPSGTSPPPPSTQPHSAPYRRLDLGGGIAWVNVVQNVGPLYNASITTAWCHPFFLISISSWVSRWMFVWGWTKWLDCDLYRNIIRLLSSSSSSEFSLQFHVTVASWPHTLSLCML